MYGNYAHFGVQHFGTEHFGSFGLLPTRAQQQPVLNRVPTIDQNRLARFTEIVAGIFNSLFRRGLLVMKDGQAEWSITADAMSGNGPPAAGLGEPGAIYFDVSDPMNLQFWFKS